MDQPLKQWLTGEKEGKMEIQKLEYLENEKSFLDEIKNVFHSFWRAIIKNEIDPNSIQICSLKPTPPFPSVTAHPHLHPFSHPTKTNQMINFFQRFFAKTWISPLLRCNILNIPQHYRFLSYNFFLYFMK